MASIPYSVWCPALEKTSGGIRVLYGLIGGLLLKGQIVAPNAGSSEGDFITIYPEIVNGNPFNSKKVVRYILNKPGIMGMGGVPGPVTFPKEDKLWVFSELYNDGLVDSDHVMFLPVLDLHTFKVTNKGKRTKKCKLIGKGSDFHLPETEGLFELTREFSNDQSKLAEYLNECEVLYSYDPNSAMMEVARLCGCRVVIIPSIYKWEDYEKYEPGLEGVSFIKEEQTNFDPYEFREHYKGLVKKFDLTLERFIDETQTM